MDHIACPACGAENSFIKDECEKCGADLGIIKKILNNSNRHYNTALDAAKQGRYDEAVVDLKAAIELWSKNPNYHNLLGTVYARKGLYDLAVKSWEATLHLDPTFDRAYQSIDKARKAEIHLHQQYTQRPYKMMAAWAGTIAVVAVIALVTPGGKVAGRARDLSEKTFGLASAKEEITELQHELAAKPAVDSKEEVLKLNQVIDQQKEQIKSLSDKFDIAALAAGQKDTRINDYLKQIKELQSDIQYAKGRDGEAEKLTRDIKELSSKNKTLKSEKADLASKNKMLIAQNKQLNSSADSLKKDITNIKATLRNSQENYNAEATARVALEKQLAEAVLLAETFKAREELVVQAFEQWQQGKYPEVLFYVEQMEALDINPLLTEDLRTRAQEQQRRLNDPFYLAKRESEARKAAEEDMKLREEFAAPEIKKAQGAMRKKDWQGAEQATKKALEFNPNSEQARELLVEISTKSRQEEEQRIANMNEHLQSAQAYMQKLNFDRAIKDYESAVSYSRKPEMKERIRTAITNAKKQKAALENTRKAREAAFNTTINEAQKLFDDGIFDGAMKEVSKALKLNPDSRQAKKLQSRILSAIEKIKNETDEE